MLLSKRFEATTAAAIPAIVPSIITGYTLFVPVEIAIRGVLLITFATALFVPSPPRVTIQPTPISSISFTAFIVSSIPPNRDTLIIFILHPNFP